MLANTRCHQVIVLDVAQLSPVTDYLILATGTSPRQMRSACDDVIELGEERDFSALNRCGYEGENWILVDFVNVVVHVFSQESRLYYDMDSLWGDGKRVEWQEKK